jgi:pimeloyl-ACP methyl ester carboxylesterase
MFKGRLVAVGVAVGTAVASSASAMAQTRSDHAPVNGLDMYYEVHGAGRSIAAPTLLIVGDADVVRPEHAVEMFRLLGGGVPGDLAGLPRARLAVLPGTAHVTLIDRADWLTPMVTEFLDAPMLNPK